MTHEDLESTDNKALCALLAHELSGKEIILSTSVVD